MSGGHYDYMYSRMGWLAESISKDASNVLLHEYIPGDIRDSMREYAEKLLAMSEVAKGIEMYMSGNIGAEKLREIFKKWGDA